MTRESFERLLTDLYDIYQPSKKGDIAPLLDKYNGQEFDAVYHLLFKYNYPKSEHYNPNIGTPASIRQLIDKYSAGEPVLSAAKPTPIDQQEIIHKKVQEANEQIKNTVNETAGQVQNIADEKIKELDTHISKRLQEFLKLKEELGIMIFEASKAKVKVEDDSNIEVKINILWNEKELVIPKSIKNMCIGTRFLVFDVDNKFHGLEVKDITEDYISSPGKCIKEITIDKV